MRLNKHIFSTQMSHGESNVIFHYIHCIYIFKIHYTNVCKEKSPSDVGIKCNLFWEILQQGGPNLFDHISHSNHIDIVYRGHSGSIIEKK